MSEREHTAIIVIHCADTKPSMDHVNEAEIRQWHIERGWSDAGYNIVIPRRRSNNMTGLIEIARPMDYRGAHAKGYNNRALGICLVGGKSEDGEPEDNFLPAQFAALRIAIEMSLAYAPRAGICGHNYLAEGRKTCPNFDVEKWCRWHGFPVWVKVD